MLVIVIFYLPVSHHVDRDILIIVWRFKHLITPIMINNTCCEDPIPVKCDFYKHFFGIIPYNDIKQKNNPVHTMKVEEGLRSSERRSAHKQQPSGHLIMSERS